ncbi:hypothetical protein [Kitasatospora sp. NPDC090091]|uniref:hypothetical protein n=1 Tax=Kitasatospora sp. NPDC090091 TaxID=3364081 RepID=UPI0038135EDD
MTARSHGLFVQTPNTDHTIALDPGQYAAALPHQCDEWVIGWGSPVTVIDALQQLIDEATAAIATLRADHQATR